MENPTIGEQYAESSNLPQTREGVYIGYKASDPDAATMDFCSYLDERAYRVRRYQCDNDQHFGYIVASRADIPKIDRFVLADELFALLGWGEKLPRVYVRTTDGGVLVTGKRDGTTEIRETPNPPPPLPVEPDAMPTGENLPA